MTIPWGRCYYPPPFPGGYRKIQEPRKAGTAVWPAQLQSLQTSQHPRVLGDLTLVVYKTLYFTLTSFQAVLMLVWATYKKGGYPAN